MFLPRELKRPFPVYIAFTRRLWKPGKQHYKLEEVTDKESPTDNGQHVAIDCNIWYPSLTM